MEIDEFVDEIRQCRFCRTDSADGLRTPFVYSSADPDILVVSEMPPFSAWKEDIGALWAKHDLFTRSTKGAPHTLCEWLELDRNEATNRFFWIQRSNCTVSVGKSFVFQHCSSRFLGRAVELVKPQLILILGGSAAEYFFQFDKVGDVMGQIMAFREHDCIVLYHPSPAAGKWHKRPEQLKSIALAKQRIKVRLLNQ
jgi:hypothetical protein